MCINNENKSKAKTQYWLMIIGYYLLFCVVVFGSATIIIPSLGASFLINNWNINGSLFIILVIAFIVISCVSPFTKIIEMATIKNFILVIATILLISLPVFISINLITNVVIDNYIQAQKLEYKINKIFCNKFPEECQNDNKLSKILK